MKTVHKVCYYIRQYTEVSHQCLKCPALEKFSSGHGTRGCRVLAQEFINIVKYGNPWGKKYKYSRRHWPSKPPAGKEGA